MLDTPCIKLDKSIDGGLLPNGAYQVFVAYTENEQPVTDYIGVSNIQTLSDSEFGFTENYTRLRTLIPVEHKSDNQINFKLEYYNAAGDKSKNISFVNYKSFTGGNRYIDGGFSLLTGSLFVANTLDSGIDISGLKDTGFIRSLPYSGFNQATSSTGAAGFLIYSGSALPNQSETSYGGVGLELVADENNYFRFRTSGSDGKSELDIRTETIVMSGSSVSINTPTSFLEKLLLNL